MTVALAERHLFLGYGLDELADDDAGDEPARVEPCVCGGSISVAIEAPTVIRRAVQAHQQTPAHVAWRRSALRVAELEAHRDDEPVPEDVLLRGRRCPCGGHA